MVSNPLFPGQVPYAPETEKTPLWQALKSLGTKIATSDYVKGGPPLTGIETLTQADWDRIRQEGLIPMGIEGIKKPGQDIGAGISYVSKPVWEVLMGQGKPEQPATPQGGGLTEAQQLASIGMASPSFGGGPLPPGSLEAALGYYGNQPQQAPGGGWMEIGQIPTLPPAPQFNAPAAPDFGPAIAALGNAPEQPEAMSRGEKLARFFGGAAAGAERGLRGPMGGGAGAVIAGAGSGSAAVIGEISKEEESRKRVWQQRLDTHKSNLARIQAMATSAQSDHDRYVANMQYQQEIARYNRDRQEQMRRQPEFNVTSSGIVSVKQVTEDGTVQFRTYDALENYRNMAIAAKMATAQGKQKVYYHGQVMDRTAIKDPKTLALIDEANRMIVDGTWQLPQFREKLEENMLDLYQQDLEGLTTGLAHANQYTIEQYDMMLQEAIMHTIVELGLEQMATQQAQGTPAQGFSIR